MAMGYEQPGERVAVAVAAGEVVAVAAGEVADRVVAAAVGLEAVRSQCSCILAVVAAAAAVAVDVAGVAAEHNHHYMGQRLEAVVAAAAGLASTSNPLSQASMIAAVEAVLSDFQYRHSGSEAAEFVVRVVVGEKRTGVARQAEVAYKDD